MSDPMQKQYTTLIASVNKVSYLLSKHDNIRLKHWLDKLASPMTNTTWKQNRNLYLKILLEMTAQGQLMKPFNQSPPQGPLPRITIYDVPYPIRIKLSQQDHRLDKNTPSQHKTSYHSRKNSLSASGSINIKNQRSLSKQNNTMQHKKKIIFDNLCIIPSNTQNKNTTNQRISKDKNKSKNKLYKQQQFDMKIHHTNEKNNQKQMFNSSKNSTCKFKLHDKLVTEQNNYQEQDFNVNLSNKRKGCEILKKSLRFLAKYSEQLGHSIRYKQLLEKIVQTGDQLGENFRQVTIPSMQDSVHIDKYNERIKNKLFQTDLNTIQFMNYLNSLA